MLTARFLQFGWRWRGAKLDGVEAKRVQPFERLSAMLHHQRHEWPASDHEQRAVDRRCSAGWLIRRLCIGRSSCDLWPGAAFQIDVAIDFQVVDPDVDLPGRTVGVENDQIDICFARIDLCAELRPQHSGLLLEQAANIANAELLPLADVGVHVAAEQRSNRLAGAAVEVSRKHDPRHELQAWPIGFDEQRWFELLNEGRAANRVDERQESAAAHG